MKTNAEIITLLLEGVSHGVKVSLFQPTHPASSSQTIQEDTIRFKNALRSVESSAMYDTATLGNTLKKLHELVDDMEFWKHRTHGLAIFADKDGYEVVPLAYDVTEACYVDEQYHLGPAVLMQSMQQDYYAFEINHTRPRLLHCSSNTCEELAIDDMPESFETMTEDVEYTNELQRQPGGGVGGFHGHTDESAIRDDIMKYHRKAADAVDAYLKGSTKPLVLLGVENRVSSMRQFISYPHTLYEYSEGNSEGMNEQELHDTVAPIIERYTAHERSDTVKGFKDTTPAQALIGIELIEAAVAESRIAKLILPCFRETTDTVREGYDSSIVVQLTEEDAETESLIRSVLAQGGEIEAVSVDAFDDDRPRALCRF